MNIRLSAKGETLLEMVSSEDTVEDYNKARVTLNEYEHKFGRDSFDVMKEVLGLTPKEIAEEVEVWKKRNNY
jgi:hypothetical protein